MAFSAGVIAVLLVAEFLLNEVLQINSATRGIDSGLTGRIDIWYLFLNLIAERPLFGYALDMSRFYAENYFRTELGGEISSAHNSYITILFDLGLVGAIVYLTLLAMMLLGALKEKNMMFFSFILIVALAGLTESRPLNVGNSAGLLFVILIPYFAASAVFSTTRSVISTRSQKSFSSSISHAHPKNPAINPIALSET
jgi:O-antigen ligase